MEHAHKGLLDMLAKYEKEHGRKPAVIALGKTHLEDLRGYMKGMSFEGIEVIEHNDPIGVLMANRKDEYGK